MRQHVLTGCCWARRSKGLRSLGRGRRLSVGGAVLIDESAAEGVSLDWFGRANPSNVLSRLRSLAERAVRAMLVHVLFEERP